MVLEFFALFTVSVEMSFQASHRLPRPDGSTEPSHQHTWSVAAEVAAEKLDGRGIVMDFHRLKGELADIIAAFENKQLDTIGPFRGNNASAENVARHVYEKLRPRLPEGVSLKSVTVEEERGCRAKFSR